MDRKSEKGGSKWGLDRNERINERIRERENEKRGTKKFSLVPHKPIALLEVKL